MLQVSVKADVRDATRFVSQKARKQIDFAAARAITVTLHDARGEATKALETDLDRPVPFTKRALRVQGANKRTLAGELFVLPTQNAYLQYQVFGGVRRPRGAALALPPAKQVPGGVKLNRYGNLPKSQQAKALLAKPDTFSGVVRGVAGIWQRPRVTKRGKITRPLRLLLAYEPRASYRAGRWRFYQIAERTVSRKFRSNFDAAFRLAQSSAR